MSQNQPTPTYKFGAVRDWPGYFRSVEGKDARETLLLAVSLFDNPSGRLAIDLGCGEGRDTSVLLRAGFEVLAIDGHPEGIERVLARNELSAQDLGRLKTQVSLFENLESLPECDLLNASFSLPFCPPAAWDGFWNLIRSSLRPGAVFSGQIFGDRHSWASIPDRTHHTSEQARALFEGLELIRFDEEEKDAESFEGDPMHWHLFHIVARAPQSDG